MKFDPLDLPDAARVFLTERHLASLITLRVTGTPHVVPVGFTYLDGIARVITNDGSIKVRNASRVGARAALNQIDGRFWLTLEGPISVSRDPDDVALAVELYARRYRQPRINPTRVVLLMAVDRIMGNI
ncbi:Pyridoxamine 5'-phosphate oxidase [Nakamurella panacisegetis]|uniref:Pyridoxamine 5'-phosphate oxidase n=1 Tax=Nakamurella panacisegetis TaxID=1090615 RepID=A0A1H0I2B1_9ACTN|nr:pyridoxamine 5'-phosphate oxidase family protein [Nakamurella panacisegetis]SDO25592.1 Pyridoxamine 5'-phosphate oxidase [Nakamurella panacisegetis]